MRAFIPLLSAHRGIGDSALLEQDVRLHFLLADIYADKDAGARLAFRGGTCLIKCYLGYVRFSTDLDFTMVDAASMARMGTNDTRLRLRPIQRQVLALLSAHALGEGLRFDPATDVKYGQSNRMMTALLHYETVNRIAATMKVDINFAEPMLYPPQSVKAHGLVGEPLPRAMALLDSGLAERYGAAIAVAAYDPREILAEKGRALLTRRAAKTRDLVDLFLLERDLHLRLEDFLETVEHKTDFAARAAKRYRQNLELIGPRFEFMRTDDPGPLLLQPIDAQAFQKYRTRVLGVLAGVAKRLRSHE